MIKKRLEFNDGKSAKFWQVAVDGDTVTTQWGKIGTTGQSKTKSYDSPAAAEKDALKQENAKMKKGYLRAPPHRSSIEDQKLRAPIAPVCSSSELATETSSNSELSDRKISDTIQEQTTSLYFTSGSSDKVYIAALVKSADGWLVKYEYGKRNSTLKSATKTPTPLKFEKANKVYQSLIKNKMAKGYTKDESGEVYLGTEAFDKRTNFQPQLLNPVSEAAVEEAISKWTTTFLQVKHDGERRGIYLRPEGVFAANRKGLQTKLSPEVTVSIEKLNEELGPSLLDCEDLGPHITVFDLIEYDGENVASISFDERTQLLKRLQSRIVALKLSDTITCDIPVLCDSSSVLTSFIKTSKEEKCEGIVLREGAAPYTPGRPASGGSALKLKFIETATVKVKSLSEQKRSVAMEVLDGSTWITVGNCSIPSTWDLPEIGSLIEVQYLYAYEGGSIYQPVYKGQRNDLDLSDASTNQLKYKRI